MSSALSESFVPTYYPIGAPRRSRTRWGLALGALAVALVGGSGLMVALHRPTAGTPHTTPVNAPAKKTQEHVDIVLESSPSGAEVVHGGTVRGRTPLKLELARSADTARLELRLPGFLPERLDVPLEQSARVRIALKQVPPPPASLPRTKKVIHPVGPRKTATEKVDKPPEVPPKAVKKKAPGETLDPFSDD